ncbi:MAG: EAL domain-containing protein [Candidatus Saccharibacteria bacterium]
MESELIVAPSELQSGASWVWDVVSEELTVSPQMAALLDSGDRKLATLSDLVFGMAADRNSEQDILRRVSLDALEQSPLAAICISQPYELTFLSKDRKRWFWLRAECIVVEGHIETVYGRIDEVTTHLREVELAREEATIDSLTGLNNKRLFEQKVAEALNLKPTSAISRVGEKIAYISLDLDRLKYINDTCSHLGGDEVLQSLGARLQSLITDDGSIVAGRLSGDEFAILGRCQSEDEYEALLKTVHALLSFSHEFSPHIQAKIRQLQVTVSMGVAYVTLPLSSTMSANQLRANSDLALYASKRGQGHQYVVYSGELRAEVDRANINHLHLSSKLDSDSLPLAWMPIADIQTGQIIGVELLLDDITKAELGVETNEDVIRSLDEFGLLEQHDTLSIYSAMVEHHATNQDYVSQPIYLAVNLTPQNLVGGTGSHHGNIVEFIGQLLEWTKLPAHLLHLEISEDQPLDPTNVELHDALAGLKKLGVILVCDDFGKGYSNFDRLIKFPYFSAVKIDKLLTGQLHVRPSVDRDMITNLIKLLREAHFNICAEGVESLNQLPRLKAAGCQSVQGYLIGQKLSTSAFHEYLKNNREGHWIRNFNE